MNGSLGAFARTWNEFLPIRLVLWSVARPSSLAPSTSKGPSPSARLTAWPVRDAIFRNGSFDLEAISCLVAARSRPANLNRHAPLRRQGRPNLLNSLSRRAKNPSFTGAYFENRSGLI
jgi:hypothetical protein